MKRSRRHHFVPSFLLSGFAEPATNDGRLFVLDSARKKCFAATPDSTGFRTDFNRVEPQAHPDPQVVEDFYAKIESKAAPVIQAVRETGRVPSGSAGNQLMPFIAIQLTRTPRFRRLLEGNFFEIMETEWRKYMRDKASRRRFAQRQKKFSLPEDMWSPEAMIAKLKSGEYKTTTDDNWKISISIECLNLYTQTLSTRHWFLQSTDGKGKQLIIADAPVGLVHIGTGTCAVGIAKPDTVVFLPISSRQALVGVFPQAMETARERLGPIVMNTVSYAWSLEQCFSSTEDFLIDEPDRGPTPWSTFQQEGTFPKLVTDIGDLADDYAGKASCIDPLDVDIRTDKG